MKKIKLMLIGIFVMQISFSQDIIVLNDQSKIKSNILSVDKELVKYTKYGEKNPVYSLATEDISYIEIKGRRDYLNEFKELSIKVSNLPQDSIKNYNLGRENGFKIYNAQNIKTTTTITTILLPPAGLITSVLSSAVPPDDYRKDLVIDNKYYVHGYYDGARLKKRRKAWGGFGLGMGILIGTSLILSAATGGQ